MNRFAVVGLALLALTGCVASPPSGAVVPTFSPTVTPEATPTQLPDTSVAAMVVSGSGLTTENAEGETLASVQFGDGPAALEAFITLALGVESTKSFVDQICIVPFDQYAWGVERGNGAVTLHVPVESDPPALDVFVVVRAAQVNGVALRASSGLAVGDDVSSIPATLPPAQTVGLHDNVEGTPDPTSFVFDAVGEFEREGVQRAYGGTVFAEADIALSIYAPRFSSGDGC